MHFLKEHLWRQKRGLGTRRNQAHLKINSISLCVGRMRQEESICWNMVLKIPHLSAFAALEGELFQNKTLGHWEGSFFVISGECWGTMNCQWCFRRLSEDGRRLRCEKSRVLEDMGIFTPLSYPRDTLPSVLFDYGFIRSHAVVSLHSTACIIFLQLQFASLTFCMGGNGTGQGHFSGGENGCGKRKKT